LAPHSLEQAKLPCFTQNTTPLELNKNTLPCLPKILPKICKILDILDRKNPHVPLHQSQPPSTHLRNNFLKEGGKKKTQPPTIIDPFGERKKINTQPFPSLLPKFPPNNLISLHFTHLTQLLKGEHLDL